jgi:hypothetical protein
VNGLLFAIGNENPEGKNRSTGGDNVKTQNNAHDEERKQGFSKKSHCELALFDPPTLDVPLRHWIHFPVVLQGASLNAPRARHTSGTRLLA